MNLLGTPNRAHGLPTVTDAFEQDHGWPVFASMMKKAEATAVEIGAPFYGYANGDILFTQDLTVTLQFVSEAIDRSFFASPPLPETGRAYVDSEPRRERFRPRKAIQSSFPRPATAARV